MELRKLENGRHITLELSGTIDTETAPQLSNALLALDYADLDLTLDFQDVKYITSAGLRVLLIARKKLSDDTMRILHVNDAIVDVFEMTGFSDLLNYTTQQPALNFDTSFKALLQKKIADGVTKPVFVYAGREYTWQDVDRASQIIAVDLAAMGVKKGSHVAVCAPNSINWIFTFFAIQKLGGIAVLVNFNLKPAEVISLSHIGSITHFCCGQLPGTSDMAAYAAAVTGGESEIRYTYDIRPEIDFTARFGEYDAIRGRFPEMYHPDDASIIIFTSGSTGMPKAVLSSSHNLLRCIAPLLSELRVTSDDRNCAFLPLFHVFGFATCLSAGILMDTTSYIPDRSSPAALLDLIDRYQCTMFHSVPTMVLAMTQHPDFSPARVASLRCSLLGGSATTEAQMNMLRSLFPNNHFGNIYGMSENAAISLTKYDDTVEHITQTVGVPADGVEVELRGADGKVVPAGQTGEVCIRSNTMIVCYYKVPIERQPLDDEGWLATGDLGVFDDDGYLRLVGRVKDLIIRGGENISPNEVADAVASMPEIADVKVVGVPHEFYGEEVAAAIILKDGAVFDEDRARGFLADRLARFKIPAYFVVCREFPLLGSGKVDTTTLKKLVQAEIKAG